MNVMNWYFSENSQNYYQHNDNMEVVDIIPIKEWEPTINPGQAMQVLKILVESLPRKTGDGSFIGILRNRLAWLTRYGGFTGIDCSADTLEEAICLFAREMKQHNKI